MKSRNGQRAGITIVVLCLVLVPGFITHAQSLVSVEGPPAELSSTQVPAAGRSEVVLEVHRFGRYAVIASSPTGVALQLVDRMKGPGRVVGIAGEEDGRLDLFLDRGEYQIIVHGHAKGSGTADLSVIASGEKNPAPAPQLIDLKPISNSLHDNEQRSYWIQLDKESWVHLEAAGRALRDLRLWREGSWLEDAIPNIEVVDPIEGQPLLICRLVARLDPGLYLVSAYGGEPQPWAEDSSDWPFYLRRGIPTLATAGRSFHEVSPFGIDRYIVPAKANFYRLELPEARPSRLTVSYYQDSDPYAENGPDALIDKDSRVPAGEVRNSSRHSSFDVVVIRAERGRPYILQHFELRGFYSFSEHGNYWISSVHSGHAEDSVDATGILAHWSSNSSKPEPLREQTITIDDNTGWSTRCNLLEPLTVYLHVLSTGIYVVDSSGVDARFKIEPFLIRPPRDYRSPPFERAGEPWDLDAGFYVLTAEPQQQGILEMAVRHSDMAADLIEKLADDPAETEPVLAAVRFESVPLNRHDGYALYFNRQPEVKAGLVLRKLPIRLNEALPLAIRPGRQVDVPFTVGEQSLLRAVAEDGSLLPLSLAGGPFKDKALAFTGEHRIVVKNDGQQTVLCSLGAVPTRLLEDAPLPELPAATLAGLPQLEVIDSSAPHFFDLKRSRRTTFLLTADDDALYRLSTSGLLDTTGTLRSRTITALADSSTGGSGRNFHLHQYLLSGDYQLTLGVQGRSAGHLGLHLERTEPTDAGRLLPERPARADVQPGDTLVYRFTIDHPGTYRLRSVGLNGPVSCRLDDADGWPVITPNRAADVVLKLSAGDYRLVLLPTPVAGRRLTLLEEILEEQKSSGHGPHALALDHRHHHTWNEPDDDGERLPDRWSFHLPAATTVTVAVDGHMRGRLLDGSGTEVGEVVEGSGFRAGLEAGDYSLELVCARRDNRVEYQISVTPEALVAGLERSVRAPAEFALAVGQSSIIELGSFGSADVRARLVDEDGRVVSSSDDRRGDWNFLLSGRLGPGTYSLVVQPVGSSSAFTSITMEERFERLISSQSLPMEQIVEPGDDVLLVPLEAVDGEVLLVAAEADEAVGVAVETLSSAGSWLTVASRMDRSASLEVVVDPAKPLRLRVWSADRQGSPVRLAAMTVTPMQITEAELEDVVRIPAVAGFEPRVAVATITTRGPGTLSIGNGAALRWASREGMALNDGHDSLPTISGQRAWLAVDAPDGRVSVKAERVRLNPGERLQRALEGDDRWWLDLESSAPGPVLVTATATVVQPVARLMSDSGDSAATTVGPGWSSALVLKNTTGPAEIFHGQPVRADVQVTTSTFPAPRQLIFELGMNEGRVESGAAISAKLPAGSKSLLITLSQGLVVALADGDRVLSVLSGGDHSLTETLVSNADSLTIVDGGDHGGRYTVDVMPAVTETALAAGQSFVLTATRCGRRRLQVAAAGGQRWLHLAGGFEHATFVSDSGQVVRGPGPLALGPEAGSLALDTSTGLAVAWLADEQTPVRGLWQASSAVAESIDVPASIELHGPAQAFATTLAAPALLTVTVSAPCLLRISTGGDEPKHLLMIEPGSRHLPVGAGSLALEIATIGENPLAGKITLGLTPIVNSNEGLGDEILLAPGSGRAFRFTVTDPGPVGVGLRADPDTVLGLLVDDTGSTLGEGVIQLHELTPGEYLLVASVPADSSPVRVRPAVVGLEQPSNGPPDEVIRSYLSKDGEE